MKHMLRIVVTLLIVLQSAAVATAASAKKGIPETIRTARREVWKTLSSGAASSATVAIMADRKIIYSEGFGMRDREDSVAVDKKTQFNIGSISKVFTSAAILLLVDDGKINLDEPVTTYLPDFTTLDERYETITVRMLLNHTSGLPGTDARNGFGSKKNPQYIAEALEFLAANGIKHDPGTISVYCNDGFTVAEAIVEKISGQRFSDFLDKRIFRKMRMKNSSCFFKDGNKNIALEYQATTGLANPPEYVSILGSGGIASTSEDLCRFGTILYRNRLFSTDSLEEYTKPQYGPETTPGETPLFNCGLGWDYVAVRKFADQGVTVLAKNGGTLQFSSQLFVIPDEKLSIALIFAGQGSPASSVTETITQSLLEERGILPGPPPEPIVPSDANIPEALLDYAGYYANSSTPYRVEFDQENNRMIVKKYMDGDFGSPIILRYKTDGLFYSSSMKIKLTRSGSTRCLLHYDLDSSAPYTFANSIPTVSEKWTGNLFEGRKWLFRNGTDYDFVLSPCESGTIDELPGYAYLGENGTYMLGRLDSENAAKMCLAYSRDIFDFSIISRNGEDWLETGSFIFTDSAKTETVSDGETVTINLDGHNEWRLIPGDATFDCAITVNQRIMVFDKNLNARYDSLFDGTLPMDVAEGDFVSFIGSAGDTFPIELKE